MFNLEHLQIACLFSYTYLMFLRKQSVAILLTLLFALRALIPGGYMLAGTEGDDLSNFKLGLCPNQNNFSLDSDGLDTAESPTHHHHHSIDSGIGEDVEHKSDTIISSSESCSLWAGSNAIAGAPVLPCSKVDRSTTSVRYKQTSSLFKDVYHHLSQPRAPPTLPI